MIAARLEQFAVHVDDAAHAAALVQVVDVLRAQEQVAAALGEPRLEPAERAMRFVRLRGFQVTPAQVVEVVHVGGRPPEALRGRKLHRIELGPDAVLVAKRAEAAFGGDARAGENEDVHGDCSSSSGK